MPSIASRAEAALRVEFLRSLGISINKLARDVGVPANRISAIVNEKRTVTADTALRLGPYFQVSPQLSLHRQSDYDLQVLRRTVGPQIIAQVRPHAA